jgi:hypothetical protein
MTVDESIFNKAVQSLVQERRVQQHYLKMWTHLQHDLGDLPGLVLTFCFYIVSILARMCFLLPSVCFLFSLQELVYLDSDLDFNTLKGQNSLSVGFKTRMYGSNAGPVLCQL